MKNLFNFNFKSIVHDKARWLLTLIAILTIGVGQMWADTYHLAYEKNMGDGNYDAANKVEMTQSSNNSNRYYCTVTMDATSWYGFFVIKNHTVGTNPSGKYYKVSETAYDNQKVKLNLYDNSNYGNSNHRVSYQSGSAGTYIFTYDISTEEIFVSPQANQSIVMYYVNTNGGDTYDGWYCLPNSVDMTQDGYIHYVDLVLEAQKYYMYLKLPTDKYWRGSTNLPINGNTLLYHYDSGSCGGEAKINFSPDAAGTYRFTWNHLDKTIKLQKVCAVNYNGNGKTSGSVPSSSNYLSGATVTVAAQGDLAKSNYSFGGWNRNNDGSGDNYTAGSGTFTKAASDETLYAKWTQGATVYANGGSANTTYTATWNNTSISIASAPTRSGYTLAGYYNDAAGTTKIATSDGTLQTSVSISDVAWTDASHKWAHTAAAAAIYAGWTPKNYTISFNADDASRVGTATNVQSNVTVTFDDHNFSVTTVNVPVLAGYTFGGYYTATNGGGVQIVNESGVWQTDKTDYLDASGNWIKAANTPLYAKWTEIKSTITINTPASYQGTLTQTGDKSLGVQTTQSVTAAAANGHKFHEWTYTGHAVLSSTSSTTTTVSADGSGDAGSVTAVFVSRFALIGSDDDDNYGAAENGMPGWGDYTKTLDYVATDDFERTLTLKGNTTYKFRLRDLYYNNDSHNLGYEYDGTIAVDDKSTTYWLNNYTGDVKFTLNGSDDITFKITGFGDDHVTLQVLTSNNSTAYTIANYNSESFYINGTHATSTNGGTVSAVDWKGFALASGNMVKSGTSVTFTATPKTGYTFAGWYSNAACTSAYSAGTDVAFSGVNNTVMTLSNITTTTNVYAKFVETSTAVIIAHNAHGHVEISDVTVDNTTVGVTTTRTIKAVPNTGYYFAGWTVPDGADFTVADASEAGNNGSKSTTLTGLGAGTAGTITANFVELEKVYFRNWNEESNEPLWDKVYVYFSINYEHDTNDQDCAKSNTSADFYTEMKQDGTSNIYWAYVPRATTRMVNACDDDIAFSNHEFETNYKFDTDEAAMRGDYRTNMSLFVPRHASTYSRNGTTYYNGYWKHHNLPTGSFSGYSIERYTGSGYVQPADNGEDRTKFIVKDENTIQYSLRVDNLDDDHNRFMIYSDGLVHYITYNSSASETGYDITTSNYSNVHMTEYNSGSPRFEIIPTSEGNYMLTIDMSGDEMKLSVNYPVAIGDYRLKHTYTVDETAYTTYSDIIKDAATSTTASMYINTTGSAQTMTLARCTQVSPSVEWEQQGTNLWSSVSGNFSEGKGVYQFDIVIEDGEPSTISSIENAGLYIGNYYIKTDCAPGGWTAYKNNILSKNTINFSTSDANTFDYYFCKNISEANKNVKFVIANDYNIAITDSIKADATFLTGGKNEQIPEACCVRFSYNSYTNDAKRAYMRYSSNSNFLNIIPSTSGKVFDAASAGNDLYGTDGSATTNNKFGNDDGNFVYHKTVYAVSGATIDVKAEYTGSSKKQTFLTGKTLITSNNASPRYPVRVIYDFKTNNLTMAWEATEGLTDKLNNVEFIYIRNGQNEASQVSLGTGGEINNSKVCGVFQFDYSDYVGKVGSWTSSTYAKCMFYFSFPFDVNVSDIFGLGTYGKEWKLQYYDGAERAKKGFFRGDGTTTFWKDVPADSTLTKNVGYSLLLDNDYFNTTATGMVFEGKSSGSAFLYFPSSGKITVASGATSVNVPDHECTLTQYWTEGGKKLYHSNTDSHWNMMGVPLFQSQSGDFSATFKAEVDYDAENPFGYLYEWTPETNSLAIVSASSFTFKSMNAYMVQYTGTVNFSGAHVAASVAARQRKEIKNYTIDLEVLDSDDERINRAYVELREGASDDFVLNEDVYMTLNKKNVNIYSYAGDYDVAANVLSVDNHIVPVGVTVKANGTYKFSMSSNFNGTVTLIDTYTQTRTNLALSDYEVSLTKGTINNRFLLEIDIQNAPTAIDGVSDGQGSLKDGKVHKFIMNDQMYILMDGVIYDATGRRVK